MRATLLAFGLAATVLPPAFAATVYRCGPDGRTYSQTPCPAGDGREVDVADERNATQRSEAREASRRTEAAAASLAGARERLEATRVRAPAIIPVSREAEAGAGKSGKAPRKKRGGDTTLTVPFKGAPSGDTTGKKPATSR